MAESFYRKRPLYHVWSNMKRRCHDERFPDYQRWGARGIKVCSKWMDYKTFEEDMLPSYKKGLQLDRVDNDGDYCPENCKWSTPREQSNNKRNNNFIEYRGESLTLSAWARKLKVKRSTLAQRYYVYKWPIQKVLTHNI